MFSFFMLQFIGSLQNQVRRASSNLFQYCTLLKKDTSENPGLLIPLQITVILRPNQYTQKMQLIPETRYRKTEEQKKSFISASVLKHFQTPTASILLFQGITPSFLLAFGITVWRDREGQGRNLPPLQG